MFKVEIVWYWVLWSNFKVLGVSDWKVGFVLSLGL